jgi:acetylornithine/succinyldiaminopimelate/putrescine aminotransferase
MVEFVPLNDMDALAEAVDDQTCGVIIEPVQGEGGIFPTRKSYLQEVRQLCTDTDTLLIFDEVQCGLGRTGTLFAHQHYDVYPDVVTLAKSLGGGVPIGAMLATETASVFEPGDHGATFGGNPLATAAALTVLTELIDKGLIEHAREVGGYMNEKLNSLAETLPLIREVRGINLMIGIELKKEAAVYIEKCHQEGLLIGKAGDNVLRLVPPLIIEKEHVDIMIGILEKVLRE